MVLSGEQYNINNITQESDEDDILIVDLISQPNSKQVERPSEDPTDDESSNKLNIRVWRRWHPYCHLDNSTRQWKSRKVKWRP